MAALFPLARAIKTTEKMPEGVSAQVLAKTSPNSWLKRDTEALKAELRTAGRPIFHEGLDEKGPVPVAAVSTLSSRREGASKDEPKRARLVVFGDSDFASNSYIKFSGNRDLFLNTVSWLAEEENLIAIRPKESGQFFDPITAQNQENRVFWLSMIILPAVVIGSGVAMYVQRRQRG